MELGLIDLKTTHLLKKIKAVLVGKIPLSTSN